MIALLLAACHGSTPTPVDAVVPEMVATVRSPKVGKDQAIDLVLAAEAPSEWSVEVGSPQSEGLTVALLDEAAATSDGRRTTASRHYSLAGEAGSYVIAFLPGSATAPDGSVTELSAQPIFVDIGVEGPSGGPMADLVVAPPKEPFPWAWVAGGAVGVLALGALGALLYRKLQGPDTLPLPDPPHVVARRAWTAAREAGLDDHTLALRLSAILRGYFESLLLWPATARTTREILTQLEELAALDATHRGRARHILDATDLLKFAREGGGAGFFEALDDDFTAILQATQPKEVPRA